MFLVSMITATAAATAAQPAAAADRQALLQLEQQWNDAVVARDVKALDSILADDFQLIWIDGSVTRKPGMLTGAVNRKVEIDPFSTEDVEVRIYGNIAVLTGWFRQTVRLGDKSETNSFRYTDVYKRESGKWRAVSAHASLIKAPKPG